MYPELGSHKESLKNEVHSHQLDGRHACQRETDWLLELPPIAEAQRGRPATAEAAAGGLSPMHY